MDVSVIVVSYNTCDLLNACLASLRAQMACAHEVIVVDNGSSDGSPEMIRLHYPDVVLLENTINRGFAAAANQGVQLACGRYLLLLNPDTLVLNDAIAALIAFLDAHPEIGVCAPRNINGADHEWHGAKGEMQINYFHFPRFHGLADLGRAAVRRLSWSGSDAPTSAPFIAREGYMLADWLRGCSLFMRAELYRKLGGMDEGFFLYLEDIDLCRRIKQVGLGCAVVLDAIFVHYGGASYHDYTGVRFKSMVGAYYLRAKYYYVHKERGRRAEWSVRMADLIVGSITLGRSLVAPATYHARRAWGRLLMVEALRLSNNLKHPAPRPPAVHR